MHPGAPDQRGVHRLQPEVHTSVLCGVLRGRTGPARVPLSRGVFLGCRRPCSTRASTASSAAGYAGAEGRRGSRGRHVRARGRRVAIDAAMLLVVLVLAVQMWLLTATLESYLAGHHGVALPALLSSLALFGVCGLLYRLVLRIDAMKD